MEPGTSQHWMPSTVFAGVIPRVRTPQVATSPDASREKAIGDAQRQKLDQRLNAILRGLVEGFACDAATFYALDTSSSELVLRTEYQATESESAPQHRSLSTARADVAAMAGNAIVLEDDLDVAAWPVPVWCGAAVCLPVASDETIHGTLWMICSDPRSFADAELQLAEVVAGRLAVELELHTWRTAARGPASGVNDPAPCPQSDGQQDPSPASAAASPAAGLTSTSRLSTVEAPRVLPANAVPQADDWELAGTVAASDLGAFYDWQTLADGRTLVASASVVDGQHQSWLEAARIALRAHAAQSIDAGELLTYANHTLWLASPGGDGLAVAVALLDDDGTRVSLATAGDAGIARWRAATCEWTAADCPPLGWAERTSYTPNSAELMVRERLILTTITQDQPGPKALTRLATRLRHNTPSELRGLTGKRALRLFGEAATHVGLMPASMALVRRR